MNRFVLIAVLASVFLMGCGSWDHSKDHAGYSQQSTQRLPASQAQIESWRGGKEIRFVVRNESGFFDTHGVLRLESWNDGDQTSEWVARRKDGTLVSGGYKGRLEKFKVKAGENEQIRLVIRNSKGWFVTWTSMEDKLSQKWESWKISNSKKREARFVIRDANGLVNHAKGRLENWGNFAHPVLVARDSYDDGNNGKILSWIAPKVNAKGDFVGYQNPDNNMRFLPYKNQ